MTKMQNAKIPWESISASARLDTKAMGRSVKVRLDDYYYYFGSGSLL